MKLTPVITEVLSKCQTLHPAHVVGGYLRDTYLGETPSDVDIATECSLAELKHLFPRLTWTEKGFSFGVARVSYKGTEFEFTSHPEGELTKHDPLRDFTINSLYHDGQHLRDPYHALRDLNSKVIASLEDPASHFHKNPQAYLRAIRLSAKLGFSIHPKLMAFMREHPSIFFENSSNRVQNEGYKILGSPYPLLAFHYLAELGKMTPVPFDAHKKIPFHYDNLAIRLTYLSSLVGLYAMDQFVDLFELSKSLPEKYHFFHRYLDDDCHPVKPSIVNQVLLLKKYQHADNPIAFKQFVINLATSK